MGHDAAVATTLRAKPDSAALAAVDLARDTLLQEAESTDVGEHLGHVVEGERVIEGFRSLAGATDPTVAAPGTIRGDLGRDWGLAVQQNLVHGSDSSESAAREIGIWFPDLG